MATSARAAAVAIVALAAFGTRTYFLRYGIEGAERWLPMAGPQSPALAHFDHGPRHGGLVLMNGDTHFEVLVSRDGRYTVYFSDVVRTPLPPESASAVRVALTHAGRPQETTSLEMDARGGRWIGRGSPIADANAVVRITYEGGETPYWIDVPVSAWPGVVTPAAQ